MYMHRQDTHATSSLLYIKNFDAVRFQFDIDSFSICIEHFCFFVIGAVIYHNDFSLVGIKRTICVYIAASP